MPTLSEQLLNSVFVSTEQTGTGAPQNIAHGLARAPSIVFFFANTGFSLFWFPLHFFISHILSIR